jgi:flagellar basal-body rod protein FlgF
LDVAIKGEGWIKVEGKDGEEAYTRAGDLRITQQGFLQTGSGLKILGDTDKPIIIPPADKVAIGQDGTISIIPLGADATTLAVVETIRLVNPELENIEKRGDGLMYHKNGVKQVASADVSLITGALEGSNVNAVAAMVEMIELARNFELQTKVMSTVDENSGVSAKLMQMA